MLSKPLDIFQPWLERVAPYITRGSVTEWPITGALHRLSGAAAGHEWDALFNDIIDFCSPEAEISDSTLAIEFHLADYNPIRVYQEPR